jgi:hypothetical protein
MIGVRVLSMLLISVDMLVVRVSIMGPLLSHGFSGCLSGLNVGRSYNRDILISRRRKLFDSRAGLDLLFSCMFNLMVAVVMMLLITMVFILMMWLMIMLVVVMMIVVVIMMIRMDIINVVGRVIADLSRVCVLLRIDELGGATLDDIALDALAMAAPARAAMARAATVGAIFRLFFSFAMCAFVGFDQSLTVRHRDLIIVRMDFAEGEEAVAIAAIFDEGRLQRRLDARHLG